jgi:hypothetical protein
MNSDGTSFLVFGGIIAIFMMGVWTALTFYKYDTFDCTNSCGGKHSIYTNNACYCKVGE